MGPVPGSSSPQFGIFPSGPGFAPSGFPSSGASTWNRPLTPEEDAALRRRGSSPSVGITRALGLLFGLASLLLGLGAVLGVAWDWDIYPIEVVIVGVGAVVLGGVSQSIRGPVSKALRLGQVTEVRGPAQPGGPEPGSAVRILIGNLQFRLPRAIGDSVARSSPAGFGYVPAGRSQPMRNGGAATPVLVVSVGGASLADPRPGLLLS